MIFLCALRASVVKNGVRKRLAMDTDKSFATTAKSTNNTGLIARLQSVPGQIWMVLAMLSFAAGNVYDQAATQNINRPHPLVAATIQAIPVFLYGLLGYLLFVRPSRAHKTIVETAEIKAERRRGWRLFAIAGVFTQIGTAAFFQALIVSHYQGLNITLPFVQTWELMAILMGAFFLKEKPTWTLYVGMVIMVCGLAGVAIATHAQEDPFKSPDWYWAIPCGLGAAFCWATAAILARVGMQKGVNPFGGLGVQYFVGGIAAAALLWILDLFQGQDNLSQVVKLDGQVLLYVIGGAVINGILATGFLTFALRVAPAHKVLPINAVYPALAVLLGWLILGDKNRPELWAFLSLLVVAGGLIFTQVGPYLLEKKPGVRRPAESQESV